MLAPTTHAEPAVASKASPEQQAAQAVIDQADYRTMLEGCIPTLRSELYAAEFMRAELATAGDVQVHKRRFLKAAKRIVGGLPPMTDAALRVVANSAKG